MEYSPRQTTSWATNQAASKFKKIEIISSIFSDYNTMRLDINYRKKTAKKHKHMKIKQYTTK